LPSQPQTGLISLVLTQLGLLTASQLLFEEQDVMMLIRVAKTKKDVFMMN
jgi:hypothetical protein